MSEVRRQAVLMPRPNWGWQDDAACRGKDVVLLSAGRADHVFYCPRRPVAAGAAAGLRRERPPLERRWAGLRRRPRPAAGQAALARRIRRRRSADRSSSFSPPHVPYFSGRLTA